MVYDLKLVFEIIELGVIPDSSLRHTLRSYLLRATEYVDLYGLVVFNQSTTEEIYVYIFPVWNKYISTVL